MPEAPFDLAGARILVTGGGSGIGRACLAKCRACGARTVSLDVRCAPEEDQAATARVVADVRDPRQVEEAVAAAARTLGGLDVLIQCAGVAQDGVLWKLDPADWDETLGVNLTGAWNVLRSSVPHLRKSGRGSVVHVGSINGRRGKFGQAAYASAKAGLVGLTKTAARELGAFGIRVNAVTPGLVLTPMTAGLPERVREAARREALLEGDTTPEDVAHAILFLCSDLARRITGAVLSVDAGQDA